MCALTLNHRGWVFPPPVRKDSRERIFLRQVQKDISLRRFLQKVVEKYFKVSVKMWQSEFGETLTTCKCCWKLLGQSWLALELTCCEDGSACHMKGWQESALHTGRGEMVMEETALHLCKIPSGFSADVDTI